MKRFKVGDQAILIIARSEEAVRFLGDIVSIVMVGDIPPGSNFQGMHFRMPGDYVIEGPGLAVGVVRDFQLAPLPGDESQCEFIADRVLEDLKV